MHFSTTFLTSLLALAATAIAMPVQQRDDAVVGDPNNQLDDLATNVKSGTEGFIDFLGLDDTGSSEKVKRTVVGDPANPLDDLATNIVDGTEGFSDFLTGGENEKA